MQAIILAAGMGRRLKDLTRDNTKCMIRVNDQTLIERVLFQLDSLNLERVIIVVGYKGDKLVSFIDSLAMRTPIIFIFNPIYDKTNNIYSLYLAKEYLVEKDTLLLESDLIIEDSILPRLVRDTRKNLVLAAKYESWMDGTVVTIDEQQNITSFLNKKQFQFCDTQQYYKTVNIYRFSREFLSSHYVPFLEAYCKALGNNEYYEQVLKVIALLEEPKIQAMVLNHERWYEIDDLQDLDIAQCIFEPNPPKKFEKFNARYGGFWRFSNVLDYCYLVNPYFPPKKLVDEMIASFDILLRQYPSGQKVNNLLAANYYGVRQDHIIVGNGAAELIKALVEQIPGRIGLVSPSFDEYRNRAKSEQLCVYQASSEDFSYTVDQLIGFFIDKDISTLLLVNPDNPTGNFISRSDLLRLVEWAQNRDILCIIDESFSDFVDAKEPVTLLEQSLLQDNHNLVVIKSISKSFGVPGVRLGVLATSNSEVIGTVTKNIAIWNINSYGEFFMQIWGKYRSEYEQSLTLIKAERNRFQKALKQISFLRAISSEANYLMCEVQNGIKAYDLAVYLLDQHGILIKDLSKKKGIAPRECIRLAIRNEEDNNRLISVLCAIDANSDTLVLE